MRYQIAKTEACGQRQAPDLSRKRWQFQSLALEQDGNRNRIGYPDHGNAMEGELTTVRGAAMAVPSRLIAEGQPTRSSVR